MAQTFEQSVQRLLAALEPTVKGVLLQEAPIVLESFYNEHLQPTTVPDRKAKKSGRRYYSRPNDSEYLRTNYGNIQRALSPDARNVGNITHVETKRDKVLFVSGIDTSTVVKAGPDRPTLLYAQLHEEGTKRYKARPFLNPGFEAFMREGFPDLVDEISERLAEVYNG